MSAYENVKIKSLYGSQNRVSNKAAVSRAVRLRECPLRELRLYKVVHPSFSPKSVCGWRFGGGGEERAPRFFFNFFVHLFARYADSRDEMSPEY